MSDDEKFAGHTPGPWSFDRENGRVAERNGNPVAYISGRARQFGKERLTTACFNGHLIAAAPDLLRELSTGYGRYGKSSGPLPSYEERLTMLCTRCGFQIMKKQPYARTKKGAHHFRKTDCGRAPIMHVETLWACGCGFKWFAPSDAAPEKCPGCGVHRIEPEVRAGVSDVER